jgi:hypothetical protein
VAASPGVFEILGKLFNRRMCGTGMRGPAIRDDDPGGDTDEEGTEDRGYTFEVIHIVAVRQQTVTA